MEINMKVCLVRLNIFFFSFLEGYAKMFALLTDDYILIEQLGHLGK